MQHEFRILVFGSARDICGSAEIVVRHSAPTMTARFLRELLEARMDDSAWRSTIQAAAISSNSEYVMDDATEISAATEIAVVPPVSGG